jgi:hypothetical protein
MFLWITLLIGGQYTRPGLENQGFAYPAQKKGKPSTLYKSNTWSRYGFGSD